MKQQCLKAGDVVLAVDGVALGGKWIVEVMTPDATTYTFRVLRERNPSLKPHSQSLST